MSSISAATSGGMAAAGGAPDAHSRGEAAPAWMQVCKACRLPQCPSKETPQFLSAVCDCGPPPRTSTCPPAADVPASGTAAVGSLEMRARSPRQSRICECWRGAICPLLNGMWHPCAIKDGVQAAINNTACGGLEIAITSAAANCVDVAEELRYHSRFNNRLISMSCCTLHAGWSSGRRACGDVEADCGGGARLALGWHQQSQQSRRYRYEHWRNYLPHTPPKRGLVVRSSKTIRRDHETQPSIRRHNLLIVRGLPLHFALAPWAPDTIYLASNMLKQIRRIDMMEGAFALS